MEKLNFEQKITWVKGLLIECPMGKPLINCPLETYRELPVGERFKLADSWDDNQLTQIINHHRNCLQEREN
jgi:hypothetical protein